MAPTRRTALVTVKNATSQPLIAVGLAHKYSDVYKNRHEWGIIQPEEAGETFEVEYNTGLFTTGRDWWALTWYCRDMKTMYYSNPTNFRGIIDWAENIAPDAIAAAAGAIAGLGTSLSGPAAVGAATTAAVAAKVTTDALFNLESTVGFKQHILRREDENAVTEIVVNPDLTITFLSNSGRSDTVSSQKDVNF